MARAKQVIQRFRKDERGATAIEYGLIAAMIVLAILGGLRAVGGGNSGAWSYVVNTAVAAMQGT